MTAWWDVVVRAKRGSVGGRLARWWLSREARSLFDPVYYREQLNEPGSRGEASPWGHFDSGGWRLGLDPARDFSTSGYLADHSDVADAGVNPWVHYVRRGRKEGRVTRPSSFGAAPSTEIQAAPTERRSVEVSIDTGADRRRRQALAAYLSELGISEDPLTVGTVRAEYYRARYGNLLVAGEDPQEHYTSRGWKLGCSPTPWFDTVAYNTLYPDVVESGLDPFHHFCMSGFREFRMPRARDLATMEFVRTPFSLDAWNASAGPSNPGPRGMPADVAAQLLGTDSGHDGQLVLAFCHDNYTLVSGGVQLCLRKEQEAFAAEGVRYLAVFPLRARAALAEEPPDLGLVYNGSLMSCAVRSEDLADLVHRLLAPGKILHAVIAHSFFGLHPESIGEQLQGLSAQHWIWWVHDFYLQCVNPSLTHDTVTSCGSPPPESMQCLTCRFGRHRRSHVDRLGALRSRLPWTIVAPSEAASTASTDGAYGLIERPVVQPHATIGTPIARRPRRSDTPVRVAFLGMPVPHKGWHTFRNLVQERSGADIEFFHFGVEPGALDGVTYVPLGVREVPTVRPEVVLAAHQIDAVLVWAPWPETFSFVTLEALAASCAVICRSGSGNVDVLAREHHSALEYESEDSLLDDAHLVQRIRNFQSRNTRGPAPVEFSGLSPAVLRRATRDA